MELTSADVLDARAGLNVIYPQPELSVKAALRMRRMIKALDAEAELIEEVRTTLLKKHATKDDSGEPILKTIDDMEQFDLSDEAMVLFSEEFQDLMEEKREIDISIFHALSLGDVKISVALLDRLIEIGILDEQ